ncbi:MAG: urea ABC transporter permease subunit UrtB [Planctomycetota bacterium]
MRLSALIPRLAWLPLVAVALLAGLVHAQSDEASTPAAAPAAGEVTDAQIVALIPALDDNAAGPDAVETLASFNDVRVLRLFERLMANELHAWDGRVVWAPADAARELDDGAEVVDVKDPLAEDAPFFVDGQPAVVPEGDLDSFRGKRRVRRLVQQRLSLLGLTVSDAEVRYDSARDVGNKGQAEALPTLRDMADNDPSARVRRVAEESAFILIADGAIPGATPEQRLEAIVGLGRLDSVRGLDLLQQIANNPDESAAARAAAKASVAQVNNHLRFVAMVNNSFFGLSLGSILVLMALGLAITFGLMGVINMAHGEMLMIGAVTTWACFEFISPLLPPAWFNWYYVIAFPTAFLVAALVGLLTEVSIVRFLYKRPLDSLLATIGVSLILIQSVRLWKGDNLGMRLTWFSGGWEIMPDVTLAYNRLFLIGLSAFCVLMVVVLFRFTRIGLLIRATSQNRAMAESLGVNTRRVDMLSFAFGAGLAGLAGYGLVTLTNPTPEMGQGYIVKSFLVTVVGGVGKLIGVVVSGLSLGFLEKFIEPIKIMTKPFEVFDATWAQVFVLLLVIAFMTRRPAGLFPDKGRLADQQTGEATPWGAGGRAGRWREVVLGVVMLAIGLVVIPGLYAAGMISTGDLQKYGQWVTFAICAIGLDLIWGYMGILSLCQFVFFSIGGYCMGLYLVNHGPMDGTNANIPRALFVVMSQVSGAEPPFFLAWFRTMPGAVLLGLLIPGLFALLIGVVTFGSRVRGVYFAILTQAITVAVWLVFQKNDLMLGGTNGLTNFTHVLGFPLAQPDDTPWYATTRFWLYIASVLALVVCFTLAKLLVHSRFGRVMVAIRDDETRLRFIGYKTWAYKAGVFAIAGVFAAIGGMLYSPQKGIITPQQLEAFASIMVVVWVAVGGRGTLWGPVIGAILVSLLYDQMTSLAPDYWMLMLGGMFILVPLFLPGGVMSLPAVVSGRFTPRKAAAT